MYDKSYFSWKVGPQESNVSFIIFSFTLMGVGKWYVGNFGPQKKINDRILNCKQS